MEKQEYMDRFGFARKVCSVIDTINLWAGRIVAYVIGAMVMLITYDVVLRYVFNAPTVWSQDINSYGLCYITFLGGGYAVLRDENVRVDILYHKFSLKYRVISELITWVLVYATCIILIWKGGETALDAFKHGEKSMGIMAFPMFPTLIMVPIGGFLVILQSIARTIRNIITLITGQDEVSMALSTLN